MQQVKRVGAGTGEFEDGGEAAEHVADLYQGECAVFRQAEAHGQAGGYVDDALVHLGRAGHGEVYVPAVYFARCGAEWVVWVGDAPAGCGGGMLEHGLSSFACSEVVLWCSQKFFRLVRAVYKPTRTTPLRRS